MSTRAVIVGAFGRMGTLATRIVEQTEGVELVARVGSGDSLDAIRGADLVLDFTHPAVSPAIVEQALDAGASVLVGTSGWSEERIARITPRVAPERAAVIIPNFSLGSVLATAFAAAASRYFDSIEIVEAHHAGKADSPSGTAVRTAELIGRARAELGPVAAPHTDQRARGQQVASVPIHSLRVSGMLARQDVVLGGTGEVLTITHDTISPDAYEAGMVLALRAVPQLRGVTVGLDALLGLTVPGA